MDFTCSLILNAHPECRLQSSSTTVSASCYRQSRRGRSPTWSSRWRWRREGSPARPAGQPRSRASSRSSSWPPSGRGRRGAPSLLYRKVQFNLAICINHYNEPYLIKLLGITYKYELNAIPRCIYKTITSVLPCRFEAVDRFRLGVAVPRGRVLFVLAVAEEGSLGGVAFSILCGFGLRVHYLEIREATHAEVVHVATGWARQLFRE